ncbi:MAG: extracellular solute-binding protein [Chloroflexota bacterium]
MSHRTHRPALLAAALVAALALPAGAQSPAPSLAPLPDLAGRTLTVYSGRSEELIAPLLARFSEATGAEVAVRYGESAELAALLLEEGDRSPADLFFAQDAGALGAVAAAGLLAPLDPAVAGRIDPRFRDVEDRWAGTSGRARVVAYSTERVDPATLPTGIAGFTDPAWSGRIGWAPTNASFQAFVTALRIAIGEDAARAWIEGIRANAPVAYEGNTQALEGIAAGEVDVAFVNHYYLERMQAETGGTFPAANHFLAPGDPGALVNVAGIGILAAAGAEADVAAVLADWLLRPEAQAFFATVTYEYPLLPGVPADPALPALATLGSAVADLGLLADLPGTVRMLQEGGVLD